MSGSASHHNGTSSTTSAVLFHDSQSQTSLLYWQERTIEKMSFSTSTPPKITRRSATKLLGGAILTGFAASPLEAQQAATPQPTCSRLLTDEDLPFLEDMERAGCLYFTEQADPASGQVLDRATNKPATGEFDQHFPATIAATGYGLGALCISDKRGYLDTARIKKQVITTLDFHL